MRREGRHGRWLRFAPAQREACAGRDGLGFKLMNETPVFKDYAARITSRPAFRRTMEKDGA